MICKDPTENSGITKRTRELFQLDSMTPEAMADSRPKLVSNVVTVMSLGLHNPYFIHEMFNRLYPNDMHTWLGKLGSRTHMTNYLDLLITDDQTFMVFMPALRYILEDMIIERGSEFEIHHSLMDDSMWEEVMIAFNLTYFPLNIVKRVISNYQDIGKDTND